MARRAMEAAGGRGPTRGPSGPWPRVLAGTAPVSRRLDAARALVRLQAAGLVEPLDPLAARLLDEREEAVLRVAILDALRGQEPPLAPATLRPLLKRLAVSADPQAGRPRPLEPRTLPSPSSGSWTASSLPGRSAEGRRADDERPSPSEERRPSRRCSRPSSAWARPAAAAGDASSLRARAAIHEALAALDSRVALYDLRETIAVAPAPVMPALLRAAGRVGDGSLVPAARARRGEKRAWLDGLRRGPRGDRGPREAAQDERRVPVRPAGRPQRLPAPLGGRERRSAALSLQPDRRSAP